MAKITKITPVKEKERIYVYIDGVYCSSVRERTWKGMGLNIGDEISCPELKEKENFFWKKSYGKSAWEKEKVRIDRIVLWFQKYIPEVDIIVTGFGAQHTNEILTHPDESGAPDLLIRDHLSQMEIILLEVTGTEFMRGDGYWVRPDKLQYVSNHPDKDVWIALHYKNPKEKIIWIKPESNTSSKKTKNIDIRGATEKYVIFNDGDEEIKTSQQFKDYILDKIKSVTK